jgi:hypothetical protein
MPASPVEQGPAQASVSSFRGGGATSRAPPPPPPEQGRHTGCQCKAACTSLETPAHVPGLSTAVAPAAVVVAADAGAALLQQLPAHGGLAAASHPFGAVCGLPVTHLQRPSAAASQPAGCPATSPSRRAGAAPAACAPPCSSRSDPQVGRLPMRWGPGRCWLVAGSRAAADCAWWAWSHSRVGPLYD